MNETTVRQERQFARIPVSFQARVRPLEEDEAEILRDTLSLQASVWAPTQHVELREIAESEDRTTQVVLAGAILEIAAKVGALSGKSEEDRGSLCAVDVVQLSGGGGQLLCELPLRTGEVLELRFDDQDRNLPAIRTVVEICYADRVATCYGFRFDTIHPDDQQALIEHLYS